MQRIIREGNTEIFRFKEKNGKLKTRKIPFNVFPLGPMRSPTKLISGCSS